MKVENIRKAHRLRDVNKESESSQFNLRNLESKASAKYPKHKNIKLLKVLFSLTTSLLGLIQKETVLELKKKVLAHVEVTAMTLGCCNWVSWLSETVANSYPAFWVVARWLLTSQVKRDHSQVHIIFLPLDLGWVLYS